jgi:hypothetical protein
MVFAVDKTRGPEVTRFRITALTRLSFRPGLPLATVDSGPLIHRALARSKPTSVAWQDRNANWARATD